VATNDLCDLLVGEHPHRRATCGRSAAL
jgi:hypothetical protein